MPAQATLSQLPMAACQLHLLALAEVPGQQHLVPKWLGLHRQRFGAVQSSHRSSALFGGLESSRGCQRVRKQAHCQLSGEFNLRQSEGGEAAGLTSVDHATGGTDGATSAANGPGVGMGPGKWGEEPRSLILVEWSGEGMREKWHARAAEALAGLAAMARPHNFAPSCAMVLLGAWLASNRSLQAVMWSPSVWLVALLSGTIAVASMLANDVFDYRSGVDRINSPNKPLVSGRVHPDDAELAAGCMYAAVVLGCCLLPSLPLRLLIGGSTVATYIYTPFLKRLTIIKNMTVAAIIASSVLAGALDAGGAAGLKRAAPVSLFLFLSVITREILMDIGDIVGDKAAGIKTLAVRFGRSGAAAVAAAALASAHTVMVRLGPQTHAFAAAGTVVLLPLYASVFSLMIGPSDPAHLSSIIDKSMLYIAIAAIMLFSTL